MNNNETSLIMWPRNGGKRTLCVQTLVQQWRANVRQLELLRNPMRARDIVQLLGEIRLLGIPSHNPLRVANTTPIVEEVHTNPIRTICVFDPKKRKCSASGVIPIDDECEHQESSNCQGQSHQPSTEDEDFIEVKAKGRQEASVSRPDRIITHGVSRMRLVSPPPRLK
ncbi:hypothetical protein Salat_0949400 [Sesamum alatum]|uniref:Uncharacterized protein n=1 Tax=Sesamum alatum TaxID=300844 RepID=A0AAE1YKV5_9LAMI|nr:hypothetical protein Salat_0949400 [Sesamum alatum]